MSAGDRVGDAGLRDPDQPTREATERYQARMRAEFTPQERYRIRLQLGLISPEDEATS